MAEPKGLGADIAHKQGLQYSYSPWDGIKATYTYKGSKAAIQQLEQDVRPSGFEYTVDYSSPVAVLTYFDTSLDGVYNEYGETWELRGNNISKTLSSHKHFNGLAYEMAEIDQILNGAHPVYQSTKDKSGIQKWAEEKSPSGALLHYLGSKIRGMESYTEAGYQIIQTITTSNKTLLKASIDGVMTVVTPPVPSGAKFNLPAGEWLKMAPQVYDLGHGRFKITQEWLWAEKWNAIYPGGTETFRL